VEHSATQQRVSRVLHWVDEVTSRSAATIVVVALLVVFAVVLAAGGFPPNWEAGFSTAVGAVTVVMLFVIQHTQSRHQSVVQLKLDELIRSSPHADELLVHLEGADDAELIEVERTQIALHDAVRGADGLEVVAFVSDSDRSLHGSPDAPASDAPRVS